ncbi:MAG: type II toxin-antitoxin system HipA family toxin, partial [Acidobacteriota bacterium]|nr:type II toxin-antitoxin system HipA family toxin [Acidobacteriota bacterium]
YEDHRGWRLSPAYDLNPVPTDIRPRVLSTSIAAHDPTASLDLALETAEHYRLGLNDARTIAKEVSNTVGQWRTVARGLGAVRHDIDRMASAFEHADLDAARRL